ncbi:L-threonylcarbamoyladenylate synthase [Desulfuromonas sp. AOP6]|uniref:L-threonylcarbamoyladenylate synthase n=1 Tax=Desulfuromonas sp. AOP6 TaxID=1566351 RepID=UPI00127BDF47|nr:L-threonylcarbamoyladenylate synthase [Desulfuromonas sp. AOP6]BCA78807.1 threonylcarbamoyl-AMP synthase [Desulfuromonas sp. AOP6]
MRISVNGKDFRQSAAGTKTGAVADPNGQISAAVSLLRQGRLVSFPTETVYGLGADAANVEAVQRIFALKRRPADHPLIVHLAAPEQLNEWAQEIPAIAWKLAESFWPGPLTLILKKAAWVPLEVTGGQDTIGLRIPAHPLALDLLQAFGGGLAAPSANRFGRISPTRAVHVRDEFGDSLDLVLDGGSCQVGVESTILSLAKKEPALLRPGGISGGQLAKVLGCRPANRTMGASDIRASGLLPSHYAPRTPLAIEPHNRLWPRARQLGEQGLQVALMTLEESPADFCPTHQTRVVKMPGRPQAYAHRLYHTLRSLDDGSNDLLLVESPPQTEAWMAINNRLLRAAAREHETGETTDDTEQYKRSTG